MSKPVKTLSAFFYLVLLTFVLLPTHLATCPQNKLSEYSVIGCDMNSYPYNISYYAERFGDLFMGYYIYGLMVDDLQGAAQLNRFALSHPNVTLYLQVMLPTVDIFNQTLVSSLELRLMLFISIINSTNIKYVEIAGLLQEWALTWTHKPSILELESWQSWQRSRGLTPIPYTPYIESYAPLFAQWAVDVTSNITTQLIKSAKIKDPQKKYGFIQYDCVAIDADGRIWDLYSFYKKSHPDFIVTHNLALIERSKEGKVLAVVLNTPMAYNYRNVLGNIELYSPVLSAGVSASAGDDAYTSYYKYALTEMSTYLNGFYPLILLGPQQKDQFAEFLLNVALYGISDPPPIELNKAPVLVIRPTFAVGRIDMTSILQQSLIYSLVTLDIPFVYMSESYVYDHPSELNQYNYVIYASSQITPQMRYILNNLLENVTTVGLKGIKDGLFYSELPRSDSLNFTKTLDNYSAICLHMVFTNTSLEIALKGDVRVLHYGSNTLRWEPTYVYVNDNRIEYFLDDILGYAPYYPILINVALVSLLICGIFVIYMYLRRSRHTINKL